MTTSSIKDYVKRALNITSLLLQKGCSEGAGFFLSPKRNQCFKSIREMYTWSEADSRCKSEGLVLARSHDAVALKKYLLERYEDDVNHWIGAKGVGSYIEWTYNQQ
ncbi:unnamed protein product, partial [Meganyctiphanes norvegica]